MEKQGDIKKIEYACARKALDYVLLRASLIDASGSFSSYKRDSNPFFYTDLLTGVPSIGIGLSFISGDNEKMEKQVKTLENKLKSNVEK